MGGAFELKSRKQMDGDEDHSMWTEGSVKGDTDGATAQYRSGGKMRRWEGDQKTDEKLADETVTTATGGAKGGSVSRSSTSSSEEAGVTNTKSHDYAAGYTEDKGATATVGVKRDTSTADGQHMGTENRASVDGDGVTLEHGKSSTIKDPDLGGKVTESNDTTTGVTVGKGKVEASRGRKDVTEVDGQTFTDESRTSIGSDGSIKRSSKNTRTYTDDEGEHEHSKSTSMSASRDGGSIAHEREKKTKDGGSSRTAVNAGVNLKDKTATVGASHGVTTKGGTEAKAGGAMTIDDHGNLTHADANASVKTKGGWSASVSGEYKVEASEPRKEGEKWVVDWKRTLKGSVGGGKSGGKVGGSASVEKNERDFGTRMFASQAEAENFRKNAASLIGGAFGSTTTVDGALQMQIGESRGVGDGSKLAGELNASWGVAEFGVGGEKSKEDAVLVERLSPSIFQITVAAKNDAETHKSMGVAGAGAGTFDGGGSSHSVTVQFDLSTADGKAAFEEYQRTKVLPKKGGEQVSETDAQNHRHGTRLSFGAAGSAEFGAETWESMTVGKNGKREVFGGENSQNIVSNIPFFKGHDSSSLSVVQTLVNDKDRYYSMQGSVDSTDGDYSQKYLAKITGTHTDGGDHASSGKWRVDVNIDEKVVDKFLDTIADERERDVSIFESKTDFRNELRKMIHSAKTPEDRMRALSYFISESGLESHEGIDAMRAEIFGLTGGQWDLNSEVAGTFHSDLYLEDDPHKVFNGVEGRLATEAKITEYADLLSASDKGGAAIVGSIKTDIAELQRKRDVVANVKNYTDLPQELRQMQVDTFQRQIDSLMQLRNVAAKDGVKDFGPEEGKDDTADPKTKELRALRRKVADLDQKIFEHKGSINEMRQDVRKIPRAADMRQEALHEAYQGVKDGQQLWQAALAMEPAADNLRADFVTALSIPDAAIQTGTMCAATLGSIEQQLATAEAGYAKMQDFVLHVDDYDVDEQYRPSSVPMALPDEGPKRRR